MNNVVIIGAGQTGRGFLNKIMYLNNQFVSFLDTDEDLIDKLQKAKTYQISFDCKHSPLTVDNFEAYSIHSDQGRQILQKADLIFISVGRSNLKEVKNSLKSVKFSDSKEVDIITAENGINVGSEFNDLKSFGNLHIAESIVFCTTLSVKDSLDISSEYLNYFPYDFNALGHTLDYLCMDPVQDLNALMTRKILTYNCISACIAYLGYYKGYIDYAEAANDPEIYKKIQAIREKLDDSISREYHISLEEQHVFSKMAITKFTNRNIKDTIERNVRDVDRKLGPNERLIAPLKVLYKNGFQSSELLLVVAMALFFGEKTKTLKRHPKSYLDTLPVEWKDIILDYFEKLVHS